jgi:hypothetical protein
MTEVKTSLETRLKALEKTAAKVSLVAPFMSCATIEIGPSRSHDKKRVRRNAPFKFFRWLLENREADLHFLGASEDDLWQLRLGKWNFDYFKRRVADKHLGACDIDHIIPASRGGTNAPENLCLLPVWINRLKSQFETAQMNAYPSAVEIKTLVPHKGGDGRYQNVPRFPIEFYKLEYPLTP